MKEKRHLGTRKNSGKLRLDLIPQTAIRSLGEVLTMGADKYDDRNWENGLSWTATIASLDRHLSAFKNREDFDEESGLLHIEHALANVMFLNHFYRTYPEGDDRPMKFNKVRRIGLDLDGVLCDFAKDFSKISHVSSSHWDIGTEVEKGLQELGKEFWIGLEPLLKGSELSFTPACYIAKRKTCRLEWILEWLKIHQFPIADVHITNGRTKSEIANKEELDLFVDDNFSNFVELNENGITCFLMDAFHNQKYDVGYKRIYTLNELTERFYLSG
jgi:hypothetical protein